MSTLPRETSGSSGVFGLLLRCLKVIAFMVLWACAREPQDPNGGSDASTNGGVDASPTDSTDASDSCPVNHSKVSGVCVDFATDSDNCGRAGNVCSLTTTCLGGTCTVPAPMPTARTGTGATLGPDGKIYVIGGRSSQGEGFPLLGGDLTTDAVEVYDLRTNTWKSVAVTPRKLHSRSVTTRDGMIHTISLLGTWHYAYNVTSNTWIERAQPPRADSGLARHYRAGLGLAPDGRIFLLGNQSLSVPESGAQVASAYDPVTDTWTALPTMPTPRIDGAVTSANGRVCTLGNSLSLAAASTMDVFDPASNTWLAGVTTPRRVLGFAATVTSKGGTLMYVIDRTARLDIYDTVKSQWTSGLNQTKDATAGLELLQQGAVVAPDGRLFVIGGVSTKPPLLGQPRIFVPTRFVAVYDPKRNTWIAGPN